MVLLQIGGSPHPAVIVYALKTEIVVLYGTGTFRDLPRVIVESGSRDGRALGLTKLTHFYLSSTRIVTSAGLHLLAPTGKICPLDLYVSLREMADAALLAMSDQDLAQGLSGKPSSQA